MRLVVPGSQEGIRGVADGFRRFSAEHGLADDEAWRFQVALDEVLANTVRHGFGGDAPDRRIEVEFELKDGVLAVSVLDEAPAFDPLQAPRPVFTTTLEDRAVGGLGVHLLKNLMDDVAYERRDGRNRLVLARRVG